MILTVTSPLQRRIKAYGDATASNRMLRFSAGGRSYNACIKIDAPGIGTADGDDRFQILEIRALDNTLVSFPPGHAPWIIYGYTQKFARTQSEIPAMMEAGDVFLPSRIIPAADHLANLYDAYSVSTLLKYVIVTRDSDSPRFKVLAAFSWERVVKMSTTLEQED